ncbi:hypothetical protein Glove_280g12 [Diversispora epigaea]|uniref:Uncharacterized protein n=1 Tax=Diversispora epigaea TaxID=1348612 RepID=A0A397I2D9_9GLOM|nr:hypothetical protein Glove_280g12 [Diversispora epigaea]
MYNIHHHPERGKRGTTCSTLHVNDTAKGLEYLATGDNDKKNILTKTFKALLLFANLMPGSNSTITNLISTTLNEPPKIKKKEFEEKENEKKLEIEDFEARLAFPHLKIWLTRVLASLSRMPRLLESNPSNHLIRASNVWNLAIIDNIDFKEKSFKFGNIYDVTRGNSHATLRMAFQAQLSIEIKTDPEQVIELTADTPLFGMNQDINETLNMFQQIIYELLDFKEIKGSLGPSPNVVILEPGANPNSDEEILCVSKMYKKDFVMIVHSFLDIITDEVIFRRLIKCREKWPNIRSHLGQWHTSKNFCLVLIVLFSSYGLLSLAACLGVRFLDKFKVAINYRSTTRVDSNQYLHKKNELSLSEIMDDENDAHVCLKWAVAPLYASVAKSNYTTAMAHYLSIIVAHSNLEKKLNYCSAFKIPYDINEDPQHICFDFDETLETFDVRFIKQNICENMIDEKNLRDQINYGLLSLAACLGVRFLDKFKVAINYRSTTRVDSNQYLHKKNELSLSEIMDDENDAHVCLKWAVAPLYASVAKSNYTTAMAHYLSIIVAHSNLEKKLNYCSAFKIPYDINEDPQHICFDFDETLETFDVRFIKQNICENMIDEKNLRDQIKSSRDERERIDLLISKYFNDYAVSHSEPAINSRKESLWELVNNLITVFEMSDPLSHQLFQEYTPTEILISCLIVIQMV